MRKIYFILLVIGFGFSPNYGQPTFEYISSLPSGINVLEIDTNGTIWAGTYYNGGFFSEDTGKTWQQIDLAPDELDITAIGFNNEDEIFIGTDKGSLFRANIVDRNFIKTNFQGRGIESIAINSNGNVFVGNLEDGIFRATNNGNDWELIFDATSNSKYGIWKLFIEQNGVILAGSECGLFRTADSGESWTFIESFNCGDITAFAESGNGNIYMGGADRFGGIYKSKDSGLTWQLITGVDFNFETFDIEISNEGQIFASTRNQYASGLIYSNENEDTVWTSANSGFPYPGSSRYLAFHPNGKLFVSYWADIYQSTVTDTILDTVFIPMPVFYSLKQNFPNPFYKGVNGNISTTIPYSIAEPGFVEIKIFDILGNEISVLTSEDETAGKHFIDFYADEKLSSGIYIYAIRVNDFFDSRKMIILK